MSRPVLCAFLAACLATLRVAGHEVIAGTIGSAVAEPTRLWALTAVGALVLLHLAARRGALPLVASAALLAIVGDFVAFRLRAAGMKEGGSPVLSEGTVFAAVLALTLLLPRVRVHRITRYWRVAGLVGCLLIASPLLPVVGADVGGQSGWISIAGITVTPGEPGRCLVILALALLLAQTRGVPGLGATDLARVRSRAAVLLVAAIAIELLAGDFGPIALLVVSAAIAVALLAGRLRIAVAGVLATAGLMLAGSLVSERVATRLGDFLHPLAAGPGGELTQIAVARMALAWGGDFGTGLGAGMTARRHALPAQDTDMALVVFAQEAGLAGLAVCALLLGMLLLFGWRHVSSGPDGSARVVAGALWGLVTVQTLWTVAAVTGNAPHSGITVPLISGGRSSAATIAALIGTLVSLTRAARAEHAPATRPIPARLGFVAVAGLVAIVALTGVRLGHERDALNRRAGNPFLAPKVLDQGTVVLADGTIVQASAGRQSLDDVRLYDLAGPELQDLVGAYASDGGEGLQRTMRGVLRCFGSGQGAPAGPAWSEGASVVSGNPARCRPAGLSLTIDGRLQDAVAVALGDRPGSVVVLDAETGDIRALAGRSPLQRDPAPWLALRAPVAPGSTMKLVTATAALEAGVPSAPVAVAHVAADGTRIPGELCGGTLEEALVVSCNSAFAFFAEHVGAKRFLDAAERYGFGSSAGVDGIVTARSSVFDEDGATSGLLAAAGIGQGRVLATPLQMASVVQALAADGVRHTPRLVSAICDSGAHRVLEAAPVTSRRVVSGKVAGSLREMMREVVKRGTAQDARTLTWVAGAKTGTAELPARHDLGTPAGNAAWILAITERGKHRGPLAIAVNLLPTPGNPRPVGGHEALAVLTRLDAAVRGHLASAPPEPCHAVARGT